MIKSIFCILVAGILAAGTLTYAQDNADTTDHAHHSDHVMGHDEMLHGDDH